MSSLSARLDVWVKGFLSVKNSDASLISAIPFGTCFQGESFFRFVNVSMRT